MKGCNNIWMVISLTEKGMTKADSLLSCLVSHYTKECSDLYFCGTYRTITVTQIITMPIVMKQNIFASYFNNPSFRGIEAGLA